MDKENQNTNAHHKNLYFYATYLANNEMCSTEIEKEIILDKSVWCCV